jgi:hypothetical protein
LDDSLQADVGAAWLAAMQRGDWAEAWRQSDRIEIPRRQAQAQPGFVRHPHQLVWDGTPFEGRSVLVRCLHGLGDTLQFMRFVPLIDRVAREVHLLAQPQLLTLLRGAPGLGRVANAWTDDPPPAHDVEIEVNELAYAFRPTPQTVPPPYPHLNERVAGRFDLPGQDGRLRVGLTWRASSWDASRSVPLHALAPLLRSPRAQFFSLQQDGGEEELLRQELPIVPLAARTREIADAAAAMLQLDLMITIDAMPAHLAATLGRPTWVLLKRDCDWRWMRGRDDSPWYPAVRLFRQSAAGDWDSAVNEAAKALSAMR